MINDSVTTNATERKAVQLVTETDHLAAVPQGNKPKRSAAVVVIAATVESARIAGGAGSNQAFHVGVIASVRCSRVGCNGALAVLSNVCVATDGEVAPLVGSRPPLSARVGGGPSVVVNLGGEDDWLLRVADAVQAGAAGHGERTTSVAGDDRSGLNGQRGTVGEVAGALQVVDVVLCPSSRDGDVRRHQHFGGTGNAADHRSADSGRDCECVLCSLHRIKSFLVEISQPNSGRQHQTVTYREGDKPILLHICFLRAMCSTKAPFIFGELRVAFLHFCKLHLDSCTNWRRLTVFEWLSKPLLNQTMAITGLTACSWTHAQPVRCNGQCHRVASVTAHHAAAAAPR